MVRVFAGRGPATSFTAGSAEGRKTITLVGHLTVHVGLRPRSMSMVLTAIKGQAAVPILTTSLQVTTRETGTQ